MPNNILKHSLTSLCVLETLCNKWQISPPFPNWQSYSDNFCLYKNRIYTKAFEVAQTENEIGLRIKQINTPYDRDFNRLIAVKLHPLFSKNIDYWRIIKFIGTSTDTSVVADTNSFYEITVPNFKMLKQQLVAANITVDFNELLNQLQIL